MNTDVVSLLLAYLLKHTNADDRRFGNWYHNLEPVFWYQIMARVFMEHVSCNLVKKIFWYQIPAQNRTCSILIPETVTKIRYQFLEHLSWA